MKWPYLNHDDQGRDRRARKHPPPLRVFSEEVGIAEGHRDYQSQCDSESCWSLVLPVKLKRLNVHLA